MRVRFGRAQFLSTLGLTLIGAAVVVLVAAPNAAVARDAEPTFAENVAPILYKNCVQCHHQGGMAPFTLVEYDSAKKRVEDIHDAVSSGYMPPWHAEGPHGVFSNDRRLSQAEKDVLLKWTETGAKAGDLGVAPAKPVFSDAWTIGKPDLTVDIGEDYTIPAKGEVEYQYFVVPSNITEEKWVEAMEIRPGAREVVHHVLVFAKIPAPPAAAPVAAPAPAQAGAPAPQPVLMRDAEQSKADDPPRRDSTHAPKGPNGALIATMTPGNEVMRFPKGTALRLRPGTVLTFQMHYTAHGHEMKDRTAIGFKYAKEVPEEEILANAFYNRRLYLAPGAKDVSIPAEIGFNLPVKVYGMMPHTHLRGIRWEYKLEKPDGTSEAILNVPHYDFNWQTYYIFDKPLEIPAGSKIRSTAWYDNSASNKHNPDASIEVKWGDQTWEEMQYTGFLYSIPSRKPRPTPANQ